MRKIWKNSKRTVVRNEVFFSRYSFQHMMSEGVRCKCGLDAEQDAAKLEVHHVNSYCKACIF